MRTVLSIAILALVVASCSQGGDGNREEIALSPSETFEWCEQSVAFQPPPSGWYRDKYQQGGLSGIHFTLAGSVGERIYVAEYYKVGDRARRDPGGVEYRVEEFLEDIRFKPELWKEPDTLRVSGLQPVTVGGEQAYALDFNMYHRQRWYAGREYYFLKNNCMFSASFLGLEENLPLFEEVVATINFPTEKSGL